MENPACSSARASCNSWSWDPVHAVLAPVCCLLFLLSKLVLTILVSWLVNQGRDDEALVILSKARGLPPTSELVQIEFLFVISFLKCCFASYIVIYSEKFVLSTSLRRKPQRSSSLNIKMVHSLPTSSLDSTTTSVFFDQGVRVLILLWSRFVNLINLASSSIQSCCRFIVCFLLPHEDGS